MSAQMIRFPKAMKRGAKVRTGPCAKILSFSTVLAGGELCAMWAWMRSAHEDWQREDTEPETEEAY